MKYLILAMALLSSMSFAECKEQPEYVVKKIGENLYIVGFDDKFTNFTQRERTMLLSEASSYCGNMDRSMSVVDEKSETVQFTCNYEG